MEAQGKKQASGKDIFKGIIILVVVGVLVRAYWSDSSRNDELEETKDSARIAFLLLDYVAEDAKSTVKTENDIIHVEFRLDPWHLTNSSVKTQFLNLSKELMGKYFQRFPEVKKVVIVGTAKFIDKKGNESRGDALKIEMRREDAKDVNWTNIPIDNMPRIANNFWKHPDFDRD